jgi:hypothetical protein
MPGHLEICTKRNKPKLNALAVNDLDRELTNEVLNDLVAEDVLHEEFCQLSLNALSTLDRADCIKLKTKVRDKVMLILVDSGSTHSFISSNFVKIAKLQTIPTTHRQVTLANGEHLTTSSMVPNLQCYCQGKSFSTNMVVLDMQPYDAIIGCDWLKTHSPVQFD